MKALGPATGPRNRCARLHNNRGAHCRLLKYDVGIKFRRPTSSSLTFGDGADLPTTDFDRMVMVAGAALAAKRICAALRIKPEEERYRFRFAV